MPKFYIRTNEAASSSRYWSGKKRRFSAAASDATLYRTRKAAEAALLVADAATYAETEIVQIVKPK